MERLDCVEVEPRAEARSAVIWLHGLGADGHDFEPLVPYLGVEADLAVRFVFPHAPRRPVTINMGLIMPAWYDVRTLSLGSDLDESGVLESSERVAALIARENERGIPTRRIVLAGFSQGGAVALHQGLRHPERLAGIVALSTYLVRDGSLKDERSEANLDVPIFLAHGTEDPMVPCELGERSRELLVEAGHAVEWRTYPMGHEVHPREVADIGGRLNAMLSSGDGSPSVAGRS